MADPDHRTTFCTTFWVTGPGRGELRHEPLTEPGPDQVRVRATYGAISRGTELLVFRGDVPASEYQRMRAPFQRGDFPGPLAYGYLNVGIVEAGPSEWLGRPVFVLHPHQDRYVVPVQALHAIPADVPPARAVLAGNLETAINVLWDAQPSLGDHVTVVGGGVVGLLCGWLAARIPGCQVQLVDVDPGRASLAAQLGLEFALPGQARGEADLVLHASGTAAGLDTALRLAGDEACIVEASWHGNRPVTLPLGEAFHARRLTLISSQVGRVAPRQRGRWTYQRRLALALAMLTDPRLDALIDGDITFADLPARLATLADTRHLCVRIHYP